MAIDSLSLMRVSGLSSGLDTESIVSGLLNLDQTKVDKQFQAKTKLEWKRDAYRDANLLVRNFREANMSVLTPDTNIYSESAYKIYNVSMLDTTNAVTISANSSAMTTSLTIDNITQIATAATVKSTGAYNTETMDLDTQLMDLDLAEPLQFVDNEISFSINGETFTFSDDTTIGTMMNEINANGTANVRMSYSSLTKGFTITSDTTGLSSAVDIVNITGNAFDATNSAFGIAEGTTNGQDAILSIEGIAVTKSTNAFTIDGINYTLKNASASSISFNVERDTDATFNKIKTFIDSYNEFLGAMQDKYDEEVYNSYDPLTDAQRDELSESDIEKWEEKAKSGLLHGDSNISSLTSALRSAFYTTVEGVGKSPADIGLRTGLYFEQGKIQIDESALRSAIETNPDEVSNLFLNTSESEDYTTKFNESGLISRISDALSDYIEQTTSVAIESTERSIDFAQDRMDVLIERMADREEALWARFTAMETALSKLNSQNSWLMTQLGVTSE